MQKYVKLFFHYSLRIFCIKSIFWFKFSGDLGYPKFFFLLKNVLVALNQEWLVNAKMVVIPQGNASAIGSIIINLVNAKVCQINF